MSYGVSGRVGGWVGGWETYLSSFGGAGDDEREDSAELGHFLLHVLHDFFVFLWRGWVGGLLGRWRRTRRLE